jgi:hypothetical protein
MGALEVIGLTHHRFWGQLLWMCKLWISLTGRMLLPILNRSLLPAWAKYRYHKDITGQELRNAVFLRQRWNEELEKHADHWLAEK